MNGALFWLVEAASGLCGAVVGIGIARRINHGFHQRAEQRARVHPGRATPVAKYPEPPAIGGAHAIGCAIRSVGISIAARERSRARVEAPVLDYAIGFRSWNVLSGERLGALNTEYGHWDVGWNLALCRREANGWPPLPAPQNEFHEAPQWDCGCGFYLYLRSAGNATCVLGEGIPGISGAVQAQGHVIEHGVEGFRAQWARVIALSKPECVWHAEGAKFREAHIARFAEMYAYAYYYQRMDGLVAKGALNLGQPPLSATIAMPCPALPMAAQLAARYQVPLLGQADLQAYACEFGQRMDGST